jgi:hypothetical protein
MFGLAGNDKSKQFQRFMDVTDEPLTVMTPIRGYDKMPLVSLEQAVKPLIPHIPDIEQMVDIAKKKCQKPPPDNLTIDQSAAIMLYTLEWTPAKDSVYYRLNKALRTEDRQVLRPWFSYMKLFFTALSLLPSDRRVVFRGVREDLKNGYRKGEKIVWWGFSSCTLEQQVLKNESFMGPSGKRTMFTIECDSGKDIRQHLYFKGEGEVLLPAAREFEVKSVFPQDDGLCLVHLVETQPKYPLLEPNNTFGISKLVPKIDAFQHNPINQQPTQTSPSNSLDFAFIYNHKNLKTVCHNETFFCLDEQDNPAGVIHFRQKYGHGKCWWLCAFMFCCPCACCYFLKKKFI